MLFTALVSFLTIIQGVFSSTWEETAWRFMPFALFLEFPLFLLVMLGICRHALLHHAAPVIVPRRFPTVSCVITCYSEGADVKRTIASLVYQEYPGEIEIIAVVDGAQQNHETLDAASCCQQMADLAHQRRLIVLPKWQRGGRVSSLNSGASIARGEVVMALDGDTSFDNDMVYRAAAHFSDPNVIAVSGNLRVRNAAASLLTRLQALEYLVSISGGKTGLAAFNVVNNVSGAFGIFRASILRAVAGWDTGTAEDLDMTQRLKQLFARHPEFRIVFDPKVIGHTDVPSSFKEFLAAYQVGRRFILHIYPKVRPQSASWSPRMEKLPVASCRCGVVPDNYAFPYCLLHRIPIGSVRHRDRIRDINVRLSGVFHLPDDDLHALLDSDF